MCAVPCGARFYEVVTRQLSDAAGTPKVGAASSGNRAPAVRIANPGSASKFALPTGADAISGTAAWSVFAECSPEIDAQPTPTIFASTEPNNGYGFRVALDDATTAYNGMYAAFSYSTESAVASPYNVLGTNSEQYVHRVAWVRGSDMRFYAGGSLVHTAATAGSITAASTRRSYLLTSVAGYGGQASAALIAVWARELSAGEYAALHANPWQLFAPRRIWVPVSAAGGSDVSVNLTGASSTLSAGSLSSAVAQSVSGAAVTLSTGTLVSAVEQALSGAVGTFSAGTITAAAAYTLAGQDVTAAAGTPISAVSQSIDGSVAPFSAGTIASAAAYTLAGQAVTTAAGTIIPAVAQTLAGVAITSAQGAVSANTGGDVSVNLSGQAMTASHGTLAGTVAYNLSGVAVTAAAGTLDVSVAQVLSGLSIASAAGTITHTGGDSATYSILPPYIAVYFWKRTA